MTASLVDSIEDTPPAAVPATRAGEPQLNFSCDSRVTLHGEALGEMTLRVSPRASPLGEGFSARTPRHLAADARE